MAECRAAAPGCAFNPRCAYRSEVGDNACKTVVPGLDEAGPQHVARCHIPTARRAELFESVVKPRL